MYKLFYDIYIKDKKISCLEMRLKNNKSYKMHYM
jgi:hypothetical protein